MSVRDRLYIGNMECLLMTAIINEVQNSNVESEYHLPLHHFLISKDTGPFRFNQSVAREA